MPIYFHIAESRIEHDNEQYVLMANIDLHDHEPEFTIHFELRAQTLRQPVMSFGVTYTVENPLVEGAIAIAAAKAYGLCLAYKGIKFCWREVIGCYRQSKISNPNADARARANEISTCLSGKGGQATDEIVKALTDCIPLKDIFSDS